MRAKIYITLKTGVHDVQGEAVLGTLKHMGFEAVHEVRVGKYIELNLNGTPKPQAETKVKEMCEKLLANTVIESYRYEIE